MKTTFQTKLFAMMAGALGLGLTACGESTRSDEGTLAIGVAAKPATLGTLLSRVKLVPTDLGFQLTDGQGTTLVERMDLKLGSIRLGDTQSASREVDLLDAGAVSVALDGRLSPVGAVRVPAGRYDRVVFSGEAGDRPLLALAGRHNGHAFRIEAALSDDFVLGLSSAINLESSARTQVTVSIDLVTLLTREDRVVNPEALQDDHGGRLGECLSGFRDDDGDGEAEAGDDHGGQGEAEAGDDHGGHGEGEAEAGDDHGGQGEAEAGDDHGGQGEAEAGDDHGGHGEGEAEAGDDHGGRGEVEDEAGDDGRHGGRDDDSDDDDDDESRG